MSQVTASNSSTPDDAASPSNQEIAIALTGVSKCFKRYDRAIDRLKDLILPGKMRSEDFWALQPLDLEILKGETVGIVGQNGSGKSTLLQLIVGTLQPTTGAVGVNGRISALLELGSGFNPEFTGRQNIYFNGRILGLSQAEIQDRIGEIEAFAEIGDFIDQPVKSYSSGMFVRLAFAVAIHVNPDILVVDEALAVGDAIFVHRCMAKIKAFQQQGGTILFVSHDVDSVTRLCSRMIWLNQGQVMAIGQTSEVARQYQAWIYEKIHSAGASQSDLASDLASDLPSGDERLSDETTLNGLASLNRLAVEVQDAEEVVETAESMVTLSALGIGSTASTGLQHPTDDSPNLMNPFTRSPYQQFNQLSRFGSGRAEVIGFEIFDRDLKAIGIPAPGDELCLRLHMKAMARLTNPIVGLEVYDRFRTLVTSFHTVLLKVDLPSLEAGETLAVEFRFRWLELRAGNYVFEPAIADGTPEGHEMLDWVQCPLSLQTTVRHPTDGLVRIPNIQTQYEIA